MIYFIFKEPEPAEEETIETIENIPESTVTNEDETDKTDEARITPEVSQ